MERESRNIYRNARAATGMSQESWAEAIGVSVESVRNYESGRQIPGNAIVLSMCEASARPELAYQHLLQTDTIAARLLPEVESVPLPQAVCAFWSSIREFEAKNNIDEMLAIAADGVVDETERPRFNAIVQELKSGIVRAVLFLEYAEGGTSCQD